MTKICTVCSQEKILTDFYFKDRARGRLHSQCKLCYSEKRKLIMKDHYLRYGDAYRERARQRRASLKRARQEQIYEYLNDKCCESCKVSDMRVLDFDHIDPSVKLFSIARAVNEGYSWEVISSEIKKCRILCANCHRIRTAEQFGWRKMARWPSG